MEGLVHLLKAPAKKAVDELFLETFRTRAGDVPSRLRSDIAGALSITEDESQQLILSMRYVIKTSLYEYSASPSFKVASIFNSNFHANLRELIVQIVTHHLPEWREQAVASQPSLPKMVSIDWRIDIKSASEAMSRMSVPTVLVDLKVQDPPKNVSDQPGNRSVIFELNKETLATMIEGLKFVQGQLNSLK